MMRKGQAQDRRLFTLVALAPFVLGACGDDDDDRDSNLVIISGMAVNIDTGATARGVVVSLLGAEEEYHSDPTGSDGLFFLEVPRGTSFTFVTNDFAGLDADTIGTGRQVANDWITLINIEPVVSSIDDDMETVIHACPTPQSSQGWLGGTQGLGSVAIWQSFLENSTMALEYTNATDVWGRNVSFAQLGTPVNQELGFPLPQTTRVAIEIQENSFGEIGYWDFGRTFNLEYPGLDGLPVQDPGVGPDIFVAGATMNGPGVSLATAFANTGYTGDTVTLVLTDTDSARAIDFSAVNPIAVPLRDGATTMVVLGSVDNSVASVTEGLCAAGVVFPFGCD